MDRRVGCGVWRYALGPAPASACGGSMALTTGWREAGSRGERVGREGGKTGCGCVWGREVVWMGHVGCLARSPPMRVCSPRVLQGERDGWRLDGRRARTDEVGGGERKPIADPPRWWGESGLYENAQAPSFKLKLQAWSFDFLIGFFSIRHSLFVKYKSGRFLPMYFFF